MKVPNNYNIQTKSRFFNQTEQTHSEPNSTFFQKRNQNRTVIKNVFRTSLQKAKYETNGCPHDMIGGN